MDLVFEIEARGGRSRFERVAARDGRIRIGRAFDNELVLGEPHVSPHHGLLRQDADGRWWYEDLDSLNGSRSGSGERIRAPLALDSGDELVLGRLRLRVLATDHPVAETQPLSRWHGALQQLQHPLVVLAFALMATALFMVDQSFSEFERPRWGERAGEAFGFLALLLAWSGLWALIGKLVRHEAQFAAQLVVGLTLLSAGILADWALHIVSFNSRSALASLLLNAVAGALLLGGMMSLSLQIATHSRRWLLRLGAHAAAWLVVAFFSVQPLRGLLDFSPHPRYVGELAPPAMKWRGDVPVQSFLAEAQQALAQSPGAKDEDDADAEAAADEEDALAEP